MSLVGMAGGLVGVAIVIFLAACTVFWAHRRAPKYLVTLEKMTNRNEQPETVRIQLNLPMSTSVDDLWLATEKMGLAATSRMTSINQDILDAVAEETKQIERRRADLKEEKASHALTKRKIRLARQLGTPVDDVTDAMLAQAQHTADERA